MNLTFKSYLTAQIDFTVKKDFITAIKGEGLDAQLFRHDMEAWEDPQAYGFSHVGWGMNQPHAGSLARSMTSATCKASNFAHGRVVSFTPLAQTNTLGALPKAILTCLCAIAPLNSTAKQSSKTATFREI